MLTLSEIFNSILDSTRDRIKNPIAGAFIFSWIAVNWRIVLILLFSNKKVIEKIDYIEANYVNLDLNLWIPLGFALFYVLILPYVMALIDWLLQKGVSMRRLISKNHRISEIQGRQEIAAEEWQLEKIRQGSPDINAIKAKVLEQELLIKQLNDTIRDLSAKHPTEEAAEEEEEEPTTSTGSKKGSKSNGKTAKRRPSSMATSTSSTTSTSRVTVTQKSDDHPVMKDIVIRDLAKTEREWMLLYALYSSDFGKKTITREDLIDKYTESNRRTDSRIANVSNNIKQLVKQGQLKYINDTEMLMTSQGQEIAFDILNR